MRSVQTSRQGGSVLRLALMAMLLAPTLAACGSSFGNLGATVQRDAFSSKEYGVKASPRVSNDRNPPKGGGRYMVGQPYTVRGVVYTPQEQPGYHGTGTASWYGSDFHGRRTANGEIFSANAITGAHPTLPLPSYVRVTNTANGRSLIVRVNDRGPYVHGRVMDLSHRAADILGYVNQGMANVDVQYVGPAPLSGDDTRYLLASVRGVDMRGTTRVASNGKRDVHSVADYAQDFLNMFGYAEIDAQQENTEIRNAHDAANAMATRSPALQAWAASVDEDARKIDLGLGTFTDPVKAELVATAFALLGAVDEQDVTENGRRAKHLKLIHLRPGVARTDVVNLVHQLGLSDVVLY